MFILYFAIKTIYAHSSGGQISVSNAFAIVDGDTIALSNGETVRLLCVDTPEKGEAGYEEAKAFLSNSIIGKEILIESEGTDKYNRTLAWITVNNTKEMVLVNKEIVNQGLGTLFVYNNTDCGRMK